jgi:hypothetical protein
VRILKGLPAGFVCKKVNTSELRILKGLEGPRGGGAWLAGHGSIVPTLRNHYTILVPYVNDYL